jgi:hypothetical protein
VQEFRFAFLNVLRKYCIGFSAFRESHSSAVAKASRIQLTQQQKNAILEKQKNQCNICGAHLKKRSEIPAHTFSKDRVIEEFDHRIPVDHGGDGSENNHQALCHYCNKCKRQICFVCHLKNCSSDCALVNPETKSIVLATGEEISDRITKIR